LTVGWRTVKFLVQGRNSGDVSKEDGRILVPFEFNFDSRDIFDFTLYYLVVVVMPDVVMDRADCCYGACPRFPPS
jgi:hypothetical protein